MTLRLQRSAGAAAASRGTAVAIAFPVRAGHRHTATTEVHRAGRLRGRARRRPAAGRSAHRRGLRRARAGSTSPIRPGSNDKVEKQLAEQAAPHRAARGQRRRRPVRHQRRVRRPDDVAARARCGSTARSTWPRRPASGSSPTPTATASPISAKSGSQGKTLTGCANDLHGPYLGPDGWIYWTKGAFAEQTYERPGKPPLVTRAAHIFRRRPGETRRRAGDDRRHGQPGRRRLHAERRARFSPRRFSSTRSSAGATGCIHAVYGGVLRQAARASSTATRGPAT